MKGYLTVVMICISQMTNDVQPLFMCLLTTCVSSLEKDRFKSFAYFKIVFVLGNYTKYECIKMRMGFNTVL